jgi:RNA 3'-terminal phosphate cyclase (ATP)
MMTLDGSHGEGGGQILRTALALAVVLGRPLRLTGIRRRRPKPGLQPQHLAVVRALAAIGDAVVVGDRLGSTELTFEPRGLRAGEWRFDVGAERGSAGSVALLFQALLLPLACAAAPSRLTLIGGTHVPWSPPVHYLAEVFLPALGRLGLEATVTLRRFGWYPAGGGEVLATVTPAPRLTGLTAAKPQPGAPVRGVSIVSRLPRSIAERQARSAAACLAAAGLGADIAVEEDQAALGPGTFMFLAVHGHAGFSALGRRGLPAEQVGEAAAAALVAWTASGAALDDHLADQVLPFVALAATPSSYTCPTVSPHLETVAWTVQQFLPARIALDEGLPAGVRVVPASTHAGPATLATRPASTA